MAVARRRKPLSRVAGRTSPASSKDVIEMLPPLVFTKEHASGFLAGLEETIGEMHG